jgi:hypothetical protein
MLPLKSAIWFQGVILNRTQQQNNPQVSTIVVASEQSQAMPDIRYGNAVDEKVRNDTTQSKGKTVPKQTV